MSSVGRQVGYTVAEVAKHCGVTVRTVKRWQSNNLLPLPALRAEITGAPLWTADQVQEILDRRLKTIRRGNWRSKRG